MKLRRNKLFELMKNYSSNNYNQFARDLGLDPGHIHKVMMCGVGGGRKVIGAVIKFCKDKGENFEDYIDLEK